MTLSAVTESENLAQASETISTKWIEGAARKCSRCGRPITNLAKQVGVVRSVYPGPRREIICVDCVKADVARKVAENRKRLGFK